MQLLPELKNNRPLAIGLLVLALIVVYLVCFHWFVVRHVALSGEIGELERQVARFKATAAERPVLEARLEELRRDRLDSALFLPEAGFSAAAAGLNRRLRDIINTTADEADLCQINATTDRRPREPERFEQVTVNVRMTCLLPDLVRVLYELENTVPLIFVDNLLINQRATPDRRVRRGGEVYGQLDIRMDIYGFLNEQEGR